MCLIHPAFPMTPIASFIKKAEKLNRELGGFDELDELKRWEKMT